MRFGEGEGVSLPYFNLVILWVLPTILVVLIVITRRDLTPAQYAGLLALTFLIPALGAVATVLYLMFIVPRLRQ
jgi:hypothetical protein